MPSARRVSRVCFPPWCKPLPPPQFSNPGYMPRFITPQQKDFISLPWSLPGYLALPRWKWCKTLSSIHTQLNNSPPPQKKTKKKKTGVCISNSQGLFCIHIQCSSNWCKWFCICLWRPRWGSSKVKKGPFKDCKKQQTCKFVTKHNVTMIFDIVKSFYGRKKL